MSDMTPEEHYEKFGEPGLHHSVGLCNCDSDMTPEQLIEELKAAGFEEKLKDQETVSLQRLSTGDHSYFFTELFVVLNPSERTGRFDYARAEPFLKAHRLDKAMGYIDRQIEHQTRLLAIKDNHPANVQSSHDRLLLLQDLKTVLTGQETS